MKEVVNIFIVDGVIEDIYSTNPDIEVNVISYDREMDSKEELEKHYEKVRKEMQAIEGNIIHP